MNTLRLFIVLAWIIKLGHVCLADLRCPENGIITSGFVQNYTNYYRSCRYIESYGFDFDNCEPPVTSIENGAFITHPCQHGRISKLSIRNNDIRQLSQDMFLGLPDITYIYADNNRITEIEDGVFDHVPLLNYLNLAGNNISVVAPNTFLNLPNINRLYLDGNNIETIAYHNFYELGSLLSLYLRDGNIYTLSSNAFEGLHNLLELHLSNNRIQKILSNTFRGLQDLQYLYLNDNDITSVSASGFGGMTSLHRLDLQNNRITSLGSNVFIELTNLRNLRIYNNQIHTIHQDAFTGLSNLYYLSLRNNSIKEIADNAFRALTDLNQLYLGKNYLQSLNSSTFTGLSSLVYLYLDSNQISQISVSAFFDLNQIRRLHLQVNQLTYVHEYIFAGLSNLEKLYLENNTITTCRFNGLRTPKLRNLYLNYNNLTQLSNSAFRYMNTLQTLEMKHNQIGFIQNNAFYYLTNLRILHLENNKLSDWQNVNLSYLQKSTHLYLSHNSLFFPDGFYFPVLPNVTHLYLDHNNVSEINYRFFTNFTKLEVLNMSYNNIQNVAQYAFYQLEKLVKLDMSHNRISELPYRTLYYGFTANQNVYSERVLDFSYNRIKTLSNSFLYIYARPQQGKTKVNLQHNEINYLTGSEFTSIYEPSEISLAWNHLKTLSQYMQQISYYTSRQINYLHNPLHCNCELSKIKNSFMSDNFLSMKAGHLECETPFKSLLIKSNIAELQCIPSTTPYIHYDYNITQGNYNLTCYSSGDPAPSITWQSKRLSKAFPAPTNRNIFSNIGTIIIAGSIDRNTMYTCTATNIQNTTSIVMTLADILAQPQTGIATQLPAADASSTSSAVNTQSIPSSPVNAPAVGLGVAFAVACIFAIITGVLYLRQNFKRRSRNTEMQRSAVHENLAFDAVDSNDNPIEATERYYNSKIKLSAAADNKQDRDDNLYENTNNSITVKHTKIPQESVSAQLHKLTLSHVTSKPELSQKPKHKQTTHEYDNATNRNKSVTRQGGTNQGKDHLKTFEPICSKNSVAQQLHQKLAQRPLPPVKGGTMEDIYDNVYELPEASAYESSQIAPQQDTDISYEPLVVKKAKGN